MDLPRKLQSLMEARHLKAADVARETGMSKTTLGRWIEGVHRPKVAQSLALARFFGVPLEYLVDDAMEAPPPLPTPQEIAVLEVVRRLGPAVALDRLLRPEAGHDRPEIPRTPFSTLVEPTPPATPRPVPGSAGGTPRRSSGQSGR